MGYYHNLSYRRATFDDCDLLFTWANDVTVRNNAHNNEPINYDSHITWLKSKLNSPDSWIFILLKNGISVALLRLDKKENDVLLTYSVAPKYRRKGIALEVINMLPDIIKKEEIQCENIIADVYKTNIASIKIFQKTGFEKHDNKTFYTFKRCCREGEK